MFQSTILHWLEKASVTKQALTAKKDKHGFQKLRHICIINLVFNKQQIFYFLLTWAF